MFYRRKHYVVVNEFVESLNDLFTDVNRPNQLKHGARLTGRWMIPLGNGKTEIFAMWEYENVEAYRRIEASVRSDLTHRKKIQDWYASHGGKDHVFRAYIKEVRDEEAISVA